MNLLATFHFNSIFLQVRFSADLRRVPWGDHRDVRAVRAGRDHLCVHGRYRVRQAGQAQEQIAHRHVLKERRRVHEVSFDRWYGVSGVIGYKTITWSGLLSFCLVN